MTDIKRRENVSPDISPQESIHKTRQRLNKEMEQIQELESSANLIYCSFIQKGCTNLAYTNVISYARYPTLQGVKRLIEKRWLFEVEEDSVCICNVMKVPKNYKL